MTNFINKLWVYLIVPYLIGAGIGVIAYLIGIPMIITIPISILAGILYLIGIYNKDNK